MVGLTVGTEAVVHTFSGGAAETDGDGAGGAGGGHDVQGHADAAGTGAAFRGLGRQVLDRQVLGDAHVLARLVVLDGDGSRRVIAHDETCGQGGGVDAQHERLIQLPVGIIKDTDSVRDN